MRRTGLIVLTFGLIAFSAIVYDLWNEERGLRVGLYDADGKNVGVVMFRPQVNDMLLVTAHVWNMTPGFHGFHIHEHGRCEVTDEGTFITAGGHYDTGSHNHGAHLGDMPMLQVNEKGAAYLSFRTRNFQIHELIAGDKTALIVHADADNYGNIPQRYGGADATTLANGDAGARIACGVIGSKHRDV